MRRLLLAALGLALFSHFAYAWDAATYGEAASRICGQYMCGCESSAVEGASLPDARFMDGPAHHCYGAAWDYPEPKPGVWSRPTVVECPSLEKALAWLNRSAAESGCARWRGIGTALHYFLDSKEFWNTVVEANRSCVGEQEGEVGDYLVFGGPSWRSCQCGVCVSSGDFDAWFAEFRHLLKPLVGGADGPSATVVSNDLDLPAARRLGGYLESWNVTVTYAAPAGFAPRLASGLMVVLGGQNAPGIGELVSGVFTEADRSSVLKAIFTGAVIVKGDVWAPGQTVYFIGGYGVNETANGAWGAREDVLSSALALAASEEPQAQDGGACKADSDCGGPYWGPYVCSSKKTASRVLYDPACRGGACVVKAGRPTSDGCGSGGFCVPMRGCVPLTEASSYDGLNLPSFDSWIVPERSTELIGRSISVVVRAKSRLDGDYSCEYYGGGSGWASMGSVNSTLSREMAVNVSSAVPGRHVRAIRVRCLNGSSGAESRTVYYGEHNFTLDAVAPPIVFSAALSPENVVLSDCFDTANVTLRIDNLCGHALACDYLVGNSVASMTVRPVGGVYNVSEYRWIVLRENKTYVYPDRFSAGDFAHAYEYVDSEGRVVRRKAAGGAASSYIENPENLTVVYVTPIINRTSTYQWDYPHWGVNTFTVGSDECALSEIPVTVSCTDQYNQRSTLSRKIRLTLLK